MITKQTILDEIEEINRSLHHLAVSGVRGFDCSPQSLETLAGWVHPGVLSAETLADIRSDLGDCQRCKLASGRTHIVFGKGHAAAKLVFVGEGPGFEEDQKGEPFVGAAGQLLTRIIAAINLSRKQVYICNIIKCRPPGNRNPEPDEIESCLPFLERQIAAIQPDFICALGKVAAQTLLKSDMPISKLRGRFYDYKGIQLLPTYHPAYLLRSPDKKREVWEDMKMLMREYRYED
jgi:DNA polymerase